MTTLESDLTAIPTVVRSHELDPQATDSGDCIRETGVGPGPTPATRIWFGRVTNEPGYRSLPHHHGEAETGGYLLAGQARVYFGEGYQEFADMEPGDFIFVPPAMPHVEANMSLSDDLVWLTSRTPDNIVVNLPDVPDDQLAGYRRP